MSNVNLKHGATLTIEPDDMCAILTDNFCGSFGAFAKMQVEAVWQDADSRQFTVELTPIKGGEA